MFGASMLRERGCLECVQTVCSDPGFEGYTRYRVLLDTGSQTLRHLGRFYNHFSLEEMFQSVLRASMLIERGCLDVSRRSVVVLSLRVTPGIGFC